MKQSILLHVEDDEATALLVKLALSETQSQLTYRRAADVDTAMRLLQEYGSAIITAEPRLILLDLNLPRRHGFELLRFIRAAELIHHLRVVILTSSSALSDRNQAVALGANGYITKPSTFDEYVRLLQELIRGDQAMIN